MTSSKPADTPAADPTTLHGGTRNPGTPLRLEWLSALSFEPAAVERRAAEISARASTRGERDVERLVQSVRVLDLTTLSDEDTDGTVRQLCRTALCPIDPDVLGSLGLGEMEVRVAAVCVYDRFVTTARQCLSGSGISVAAVTAGFPVGLPTLSDRLDEIRTTVDDGANEVDLVIDREHVLAGAWPALFDEVSAFRDACGPALMKTILAAGDLGSLRAVARAGLVCCMAGADFIKTSTGREGVNATLPIGLAMAAAIRCYAQNAGYAVGLKPAGGVRTGREALAWLQLAHEELGAGWTAPRYLRIGASSLLGQVEEDLRALGAERAGG